MELLWEAEINNDNKRAVIKLENGYAIKAWFAGDLDYFILGITIPEGSDFKSEYSVSIENEINKKFSVTIQHWTDSKIIAFRLDEFNRFNLKDPWIRVQNGEFKKTIEEFVDIVKKVKS